MDEETAGKIRGSIRRVVIKNVNDAGATQTVSAQIGEGIWHENVEVLQPYGIASSVPADGAVGVALAVGGDEGDLVVLPLSNPSTRFGKLNSGDSGLYNNGGDYIILRAGGTLEIAIGGEAVLELPGGLTINTPQAHFKGDVIVDGVVKAEGSIETGGMVKASQGIKSDGDVADQAGSMQGMRDQYNEHGHPDASPPPNPPME